MRFLILFLLGFLMNPNLYALDKMTKEESVTTIRTLLKKMKNKEISKDTLNKEITLLTNDLLNEAIYFDRYEIEDLLEPYKKHITENEDRVALINYYIYLSNNALFSNRFGESNYYLGKAEKEVEKFDKGKPLLVFYNRLNLYVVQENYDKIIDLYREYEDYLMDFPKLLNEGKLDLNIARTFNAMIEPVTEVYAVKGRAEEVDKLMDLGGQMLHYFAVMKEKDHRAGFVGGYFSQKFHYFKMEFHKALHIDKNIAVAGRFLDSMVILINDVGIHTEALVSNYYNAVYESKVRYFLKTSQADSAKFYIRKIESDPIIEPMNFYRTKEWLAETEAMEGDYRNAYLILKSSVNAVDSINNTVLNEMDNLLYAYIEAEEKQKELVKTEKQKYQRTVAFIVIIAVLLSVSGLAFYLMRRKNREAGKHIEELNQTVNFQIVLMEDMKNRTVAEERKRMGRDLHDEISSGISAILYKIEALKLENPPGKHTQFEQIISQLQDVHRKSRSISHNWYRSSQQIQELLFSTQISTLVYTILPKDKFEVNIEIDESSLQYTDTEIRIEFIRIIQEAAVNILKHSKASVVNILQYYEHGKLHLAIVDNGIGIKHKRSSKSNNSLGLQSIKDRIQNLKGTLEILDNREGGTELRINIPVK